MAPCEVPNEKEVVTGLTGSWTGLRAKSYEVWCSKCGVHRRPSGSAAPRSARPSGGRPRPMDARSDPRRMEVGSKTGVFGTELHMPMVDGSTRIQLASQIDQHEGATKLTLALGHLWQC